VQVFDRQMIRAIRKSDRQIGMSVMGHIAHRLEMETEDIVNARLPLPNVFTDTSDDEPEAPTVYANLRSSDALKRAWENCRESLTPGQEFRRGDIEECTTLARSRAGDVISYGMTLNEVAKIGHGRYLYNPIITNDTPKMVVDVPPAALPIDPEVPTTLPTSTDLPPDF